MVEGLPAFGRVGAASYAGTLDALMHLHRLGHRRIGVIRGLRTPVSGHMRARANDAFLEAQGLRHDFDVRDV